jgi:hypothetical protein
MLRGVLRKDLLVGGEPPRTPSWGVPNGDPRWLMAYYGLWFA